MTEIPEHLLQRSRERRSAMGDGGSSDGGGGESAPAASSAAPVAKAPAVASMPAHPEPASAPAAKPDSPMVEAYKKRRKIPYWAMPVLAALPLWAYVFVGTLEPPPAGEGPAELGTAAYAANGCAGCHGAGGGGGVGPAFTGAAIYETWPKFEDHFNWVRLGSAGWLEANGDTYGANAKPVKGGMPGFAAESLSDADLMYIILHERFDLGGANPDEIDQQRLDMAAALFFENPALTFEEVMAEVDAAIPAG